MNFVMYGVAYTVGSNFINHMIYDIYGILRDNTTSSHPDVQKMLTELDLMAELATLESLVQEVEEYYNIPLLENPGTVSRVSQSETRETETELGFRRSQLNALTVALQNTYHMVFLIKQELLAIQRLINEHKQRYFSRWRNPGYSDHLIRLRGYKELLDKRSELLIKILSVYK